MRALKAAAVSLILMFSALLPMSAFATHAVPVSTTFTATGPLDIDSMGLNISCTVTIVLTTDAAGNIKITQMTMSQFNSVCSTFTARFLPWNGSLGGSFAAFQNAWLDASIASCNGSIGANFYTGSLMTINGFWGSCAVSGTLTISPVLQIVGP